MPPTGTPASPTSGSWEPRGTTACCRVPGRRTTASRRPFNEGIKARPGSSTSCRHLVWSRMKGRPMNFGTRAAALLTLSSALFSACAALAAPPTKVEGGVLVGSNGMTLYTFDKDTAGSGKSVCNGQCATNWPPLMAADGDAASGDYSIVTRDDGKKQWAIKGK